MKTGTTIRPLHQVIEPTRTSDGAGVHLLRSIGGGELDQLDPFLMLDEFGSENRDDYIAGFPSHPHRGFETVTYMLAGSMRHEDSTGAVGELTSGGLQWMTAGSGVIHSEMPAQREGVLRGFQLWVNLPAAEKMKPPHYQNIEASDIPAFSTRSGATIKVIAGQAGRVTGPVTGIATDPLYLDITLSPGGRYQQAIPTEHNSFAYLYDGEATFAADERVVKGSSLVTFGEGEEIVVSSGSGASLLLLAARPLREPVARYGPFVMNSHEEIETAIADYRQGRLVAKRA